MIYGIGTDIIEIDRIEKLIEKMGDKFLNRVFTNDEQEYCNKMARRSANYAARFAAKEAFVKALGTGFSNGISWRDIGVKNEDSGKPYIVLTGKALEIIKKNNITSINVSLSHSHTHAISIVTLETN